MDRDKQMDEIVEHLSKIARKTSQTEQNTRIILLLMLLPPVVGFFWLIYYFAIVL